MRLIAALALLGVGAIGTANASVTYTFVPTSYDVGTAWFLDGALDPGPVGNQGGVYLTISDAAVARGSFVLNAVGTGSLDQPVPTVLFSGDVSDLIMFNDHGEQTTQRSNIGTTHIGLKFGGGGEVTTGGIQHGGISQEVFLSGSSAHFSGTFGANDQNCGIKAPACGVSGVLVSADPADVPEPSSAAGLLAGILALGALRRRA